MFRCLYASKKSTRVSIAPYLFSSVLNSKKAMCKKIRSWPSRYYFLSAYYTSIQTLTRESRELARVTSKN